jgi:hypothetical protein
VTKEPRRNQSTSCRRVSSDAASDEGSAPLAAGSRPVQARRELAGQVAAAAAALGGQSRERRFVLSLPARNG